MRFVLIKFQRRQYFIHTCCILKNTQSYIICNGLSILIPSDGKLMWKINPCARIESMLEYEIMMNRGETRNEMIVLTKSNHLQRFHLESGKHLETLWLSNTAKFTDLSWVELFNSCSLCHLDAKKSSYECILFKVAPFTLIAKFLIEKSCFGNVNGVHFEDDYCVIQEKKKLRFYRLQDLLVNNNQNDVFWDHTQPIPFTCVIDNIPDCIYKLDADQVDFGGFPFRGISMIREKNKSHFEIFSLMENEKRHKIPNERNLFIMHVDPMRILFKSDDMMEQYMMNTDGDLVSLFHVEHLRKTRETEYVTSFGRKILNRIDDRDPIQSFDFEDDLDLLAILQSGIVRIHCNLNGDLLRSFRLKDYEEDDIHSIVVSKCYLIHLARSQEDRSVRCRVYRIGQNFIDPRSLEHDEVDAEYSDQESESSDLQEDDLDL